MKLHDRASGFEHLIAVKGARYFATGRIRISGSLSTELGGEGF